MTDPGRTFPTRRTVRLGDVTGTARVRLDTLSQVPPGRSRPTTPPTRGWPTDGCCADSELRIERVPTLRDGRGSRDLVLKASPASTAEHHTTVHGRRAATRWMPYALWVFVGRRRAPGHRERFARYGVSDTERRISTRLRHGDLPSSPEGSGARPWPLRQQRRRARARENAVSLAAAEDLLVDGGGCQGRPPRGGVEVADPTAQSSRRSRPSSSRHAPPTARVAGALRCAAAAPGFRLRAPGATRRPGPSSSAPLGTATRLWRVAAVS